MRILSVCPKCNNEFDAYSIHGNKKFCSRSCANSRGPRDEQFKIAVRTKLKEYVQPAERIARIKQTQLRNAQNAGVFQKEVSCEYCNNKLLRYERRTGKFFCSIEHRREYHRMHRDEFQQYKEACKFKFNPLDYPDHFDLTLVHQYGWYSPTNKGNNLSGVSRDHRLSIRTGYDNNISPEIISHPANCELMIHSENNKKNLKSSITLEVLMEKINTWRV